MRFIIYFIIFGLIYYAIYIYYPDAFHTLAGWAGKLFDTVRDIIVSLISKIDEWRTGGAPQHPESVPKSLLGLFF